MQWTVHGRRTIYDSPWISLDLVDVEQPDGKRYEQHVVRMARPVAATVITWAKEDRSGADWSGSVPVGPDKWASQLQPPRPPLGPQLGGARPFFMTTGSEFRPAGAPAYDSAPFKAALASIAAMAKGSMSEAVTSAAPALAAAIATRPEPEAKSSARLPTSSAGWSSA